MRQAITILLLLIATLAYGQTDSARSSDAFASFGEGRSFENRGLGNGLNFSANGGMYKFKLSGMLQPSYLRQDVPHHTPDQYFRTKRSYANFSGQALKEKISFFVQVDFSAAQPLLDAWGAYNFSPKWALSVGQRRTFTNNREMTFDEDRLTFTDRSVLSQTFQGNGREFGLFLTGKVGTGFVLAPQLAVTSGDGPNSFGGNAADVDLGGLKYGGRLDIYPLGEFTEGNRGFAADLKHETKPKLLLGVAGSYNNGASNAKGEGHGNFIFYNASKEQQLPNYRKFSADLLFKFQGAHVLAEFINASASGLSGAYTDSVTGAATLLKPGQISQYLLLGNAFNVQAGYATSTGWALDLRYEKLTPEFKDQAISVLQQNEVYTLGLAKYFQENRLKLLATGSRIKPQVGDAYLRSELMLQVVF